MLISFHLSYVTKAKEETVCNLSSSEQAHHMPLHGNVRDRLPEVLEEVMESCRNSYGLWLHLHSRISQTVIFLEILEARKKLRRMIHISNLLNIPTGLGSFVWLKLP